MAQVAESPTVEQWKWKVESAASTLREAAKVKRTPKLYKVAIAELKRQQKEIGQVVSASK